MRYSSSRCRRLHPPAGNIPAASSQRRRSMQERSGKCEVRAWAHTQRVPFLAIEFNLEALRKLAERGISVDEGHRDISENAGGLD
jgi:hypothetical protein